MYSIISEILRESGTSTPNKFRTRSVRSKRAIDGSQATNKDHNVSENQSEIDNTTTRTGKKAGEKKKYRVLIILLLPLYLFILCACAGGTRTSIDTSSSLQLHDRL